MINLLPPDLKEQIRYAKFNRTALKYLRLVAAVVVVLGAIFGGALWWTGRVTAQVTQDVTNKQQTIAGYNKTFVPKAKDASDRLNAIKYVQTTQTHFSTVVADLAKVLPQGVSIDSLTLTGDDKQPVTLAMTAGTYTEALAVRNALASSPRIANADLENISSSSSSSSGITYQVSVVIAFKPGQAK